MRSAIIRAAATVFAAAFLANFANAQNQAVLIPVWDAGDDSNAATIDHSIWQSLLDAFVLEHESGVNRFDYAALKANSGERRRLRDYLAELQAIDPRDYSRAEQKAYWINFYNALTVETVTEEYPVDSIREISESLLGIGGFIPVGPWRDVRAEVAEIDLTLDDMEHGILRPIYRDPRIHYGVNCASIGCPNLVTTAFSAGNTEELLDDAARAYVNHPRGVDIVDEDFMVISSIYTWFVEDFGGDEEGVIEHLLQYAEPELAEQLREFLGFIEYEYDWALNQP
ncbi:MAG: DUF547 domain-containing protein [Gammaproteobacteria bacterium]|nr:DUF547 domain-containing protein [Gammaproteobacteria bacterium]MCY3687512.1 DUF547 domain-containing protein [Gammaproteobacteria bacterium]MXY90056.1 DUF547 domain-containing protein [Gammaproteobacteria bacterium]MYG96710.1 DUF547 domain-containing protein [Gammaproteobacteria bacterium]